jgi:hypothetical protein
VLGLAADVVRRRIIEAQHDAGRLELGAGPVREQQPRPAARSPLRVRWGGRSRPSQSRSSGTPIRSNASAAGADRATGSTLPANVLPAATALCMLGRNASSFAHTPVERSA